MSWFLFRLNSPRPAFSRDMTPAERTILEAHVASWMALAQQGTALVFGPVADPSGPWGLGIVEAPDRAAAQAIADADPAITAGIGFSFDIFPMPRAILRPGS